MFLENYSKGIKFIMDSPKKKLHPKMKKWHTSVKIMFVCVFACVYACVYIHFFFFLCTDDLVTDCQWPFENWQLFPPLHSPLSLLLTLLSFIFIWLSECGDWHVQENWVEHKSCFWSEISKQQTKRLLNSAVPQSVWFIYESFSWSGYNSHLQSQKWK